MDDSFTYLTFPQESIPDVVIFDRTLGIHLVDKPIDTMQYMATFNHIVSQFSLDVDDSRKWLRGHGDIYRLGGGLPNPIPRKRTM
jgi:hypothetical protein